MFADGKLYHPGSLHLLNIPRNAQTPDQMPPNLMIEALRVLLH